MFNYTCKQLEGVRLTFACILVPPTRVLSNTATVTPTRSCATLEFAFFGSVYKTEPEKSNNYTPLQFKRARMSFSSTDVCNRAMAISTSIRAMIETHL